MSNFLKRMKERKPTEVEISINSEPRSVEMKNHEPQKKKATETNSGSPSQVSQQENRISGNHRQESSEAQRRFGEQISFA